MGFEPSLLYQKLKKIWAIHTLLINSILNKLFKRQAYFTSLNMLQNRLSSKRNEEYVLYYYTVLALYTYL